MQNFINSFENTGLANLFVLLLALSLIWAVSKLIKFIPKNNQESPLEERVVLKISETLLVVLGLFLVFWVIKSAGYLFLAGGIVEIFFN